MAKRSKKRSKKKTKTRSAENLLALDREGLKIYRHNELTYSCSLADPQLEKKFLEGISSIGGVMVNALWLGKRIPPMPLAWIDGPTGHVLTLDAEATQAAGKDAAGNPKEIHYEDFDEGLSAFLNLQIMAIKEDPDFGVMFGPKTLPPSFEVRKKIVFTKDIKAIRVCPQFINLYDKPKSPAKESLPLEPSLLKEGIEFFVRTGSTPSIGAFLGVPTDDGFRFFFPPVLIFDKARNEINELDDKENLIEYEEAKQNDFRMLSDFTYTRYKWNLLDQMIESMLRFCKEEGKTFFVTGTYTYSFDIKDW